jgi:glycosyltransferase involved in cell wall biosynthesis
LPFESVPDQTTPLILSFNEAPNIARTLEPLQWATRIVVLDSGSSDNTLEIASSFPNVSVHQRPFDSHSAQWNYGLTLVQSEWVLALDADYITDELFRTELQALSPKQGVNAFFAHFAYCVFGRPLRASLYPPRAVLFRHGAARFVQDGHTQLLEYEGAARQLITRIRHDDRKALKHWLAAQDRYMVIEARHLLRAPLETLSRQDRLRRQTYFAPAAMFLYLLFAKRLMLDGWPGWYYVLQRTTAEMLLSLRLLTEMHGLEDQAAIATRTSEGEIEMPNAEGERRKENSDQKTEIGGQR